MGNELPILHLKDPRRHGQNLLILVCWLFGAIVLGWCPTHSVRAGGSAGGSVTCHLAMGRNGCGERSGSDGADGLSVPVAPGEGGPLVRRQADSWIARFGGRIVLEGRFGIWYGNGDACDHPFQG